MIARQIVASLTPTPQATKRNSLFCLWVAHEWPMAGPRCLPQVAARRSRSASEGNREPSWRPLSSMNPLPWCASLSNKPSCLHDPCWCNAVARRCRSPGRSFFAIYKTISPWDLTPTAPCSVVDRCSLTRLKPLPRRLRRLPFCIGRGSTQRDGLTAMATAIGRFFVRPRHLGCAYANRSTSRWRYGVRNGRAAIRTHQRGSEELE